jgi:hypothetical protein
LRWVAVCNQSPPMSRPVGVRSGRVVDIDVPLDVRVGAG